MNQKLKVGLNGLGRIGRHLFKIFIDDPLIELAGINEINPDLDNWAYTLNYDSIYGKSKYFSSVEDQKIFCNKQYINTSMKQDISEVPWKKWGVDIVVDCSGVLENTFKSKKIIEKNGQKK